MQFLKEIKMNDAQKVAQILLKEKAVFLRPHDMFTWTSGIKSPVYCDNRLLISTVNSRETIIQAFSKKIATLNVDCIAGTATAGIPWAAWIAHELKLPMIYVRSSSKEHGRQNAIEGAAAEGSRCVLIEDLISTGKSSIAAAQKIQEAKLDVLKVMSIFTYGFAEVDTLFQKANLEFESLSSFDVLAQVAYDDKVLDASTLDQVLEWRKSVVFP
jgi:orotate phosphoribosyltransferase